MGILYICFKAFALLSSIYRTFSEELYIEERVPLFATFIGISSINNAVRSESSSFMECDGKLTSIQNGSSQKCLACVLV